MAVQENKNFSIFGTMSNTLSFKSNNSFAEKNTPKHKLNAMISPQKQPQVIMIVVHLFLEGRIEAHLSPLKGGSLVYKYRCIDRTVSQNNVR